MPREVVIPGNSQTPAKSYPLPPRFSERGSQAHIDYRIVVSVRRRRFSADSTYASPSSIHTWRITAPAFRLFTPIVYLPYSIAGVPSLKRQGAYRSGTLPPGPRADPDGWKTLPICETIGKLLSARSASTSIHCRVSSQMQLTVRRRLTSAADSFPSRARYAPSVHWHDNQYGRLRMTQLSYAASTCIPLHVSLHAADSRVADLLTQDSILVQLVRTMDIQDFTPTRRAMSFHDVMSEGVFWPAPDDRATPGERRFFGEIPLRKKLTSSFDFAKLSVNVMSDSTLSTPVTLTFCGSIRLLYSLFVHPNIRSPLPTSPCSPSGSKSRSEILMASLRAHTLHQNHLYRLASIPITAMLHVVMSAHRTLGSLL